MGDEYWNETPLGDETKEELDQALIAELNNQLVADESDQDEPESIRNSGIFRFLTFFTVMVFLALVFSNWLTIISLPSFDFVDRSRELAMDPAMQALRGAVVEIHTGTSRGTGFNIAADGIIVTNYHVVENTRFAQVNFLQERTFTGAVADVFPDLDLALIRIDGEDLPYLELETEKELTSGEKVTIIGNPLWFSRIIIQGEVLGQAALTGWAEPVYLIKAPVHKGNSGSPVINGEGKVIAVIFATATSDQNEIIGLAVPVSELFE